MSTVAYEIVDVFTDRPFAGNPLAVVYEATELGSDQMLTLTREFNLSETVFVLPPTAAEATYRARIFTPEGEVPFAGHPSVGAAVTSMRRGMFGVGEVVQECGAGLLPITVSDGRAVLTGAKPTLGEPLDPAPLLAMAGLTADDHAGTETAAPRSAGCGLKWTFLQVRPEALARVQIDLPAARKIGVTELSVFSWDGEHAHARVFAPGAAVPEDPATGSAALGLGVWLVAAGRLPGSGTSAYTVHQNLDQRRPARLDCTVTAEDGAATSATVAGSVVPIASGRIAVPPFVG
ncbi:MAG: PhzF family phenazine biosynthesis protein [Actinoplanes sp.]